jgi:hypothetical protein
MRWLRLIRELKAAAAQRALDLIESEHFRDGATQMLAKWQAGQTK